MKGKIINTKEAVKEMMNGNIVRMSEDKDTFFAYHKIKNMIYMIHYDQITNRMNISPIASPSDIFDEINTFLQGYGENQLVITTFFEMFNEFHIPSFNFTSNLDDADKKFKDVIHTDNTSVYKSNLSNFTYPINKEDK